MSNKWALKDIQQEITATGVKITVTTFQLCHLWLRWSLIDPKQHIIPVLKRGIFLHADKYFCFDSYHDNEQAEAGDTLTHTFLKEPWTACETRYFYFFSKASPSTSPIFSKHRVAPPWGPPITTIFYPDPHPESTSVDGYIEDSFDNLTWPNAVAATGTTARDSGTSGYVEIVAGLNTNRWNRICRAIFLFNTTSIPTTAQILSATLQIQGKSKYDPKNWKPNISVYSSSPASNTALIPADTLTIGYQLLATPISYDDFSTTIPSIFTLNAQGLAQITKGGITKLALRNHNYDALIIQPTWYKFAEANLMFYFVEQTAQYRPKLTVTYQVPG